ncbi:hypothetical protein TKWG_22050 [Advenella kashmirensis WT001]|uniref:Uncharacterized protein n=1 Tax=Advenella kashmirensis (strain DSM 17095 / LMG 22695 / WT001) TaxID=1036672 RepID=I3UGD1_ADVKW|nr:hypothetical protein TKWG_22050 [Advenella kashmirensis WT001]
MYTKIYLNEWYTNFGKRVKTKAVQKARISIKSVAIDPIYDEKLYFKQLLQYGLYPILELLHILNRK